MSYALGVPVTVRYPRNPLRRAVSLALAATVAMTPLGSYGAAPDLSAFAEASEASDEALSGMRGRFASGGQIVQFGIEMLTSWQTAAGEQLLAGAALTVRGMGGGMPSVSFVPKLSITGEAQLSGPENGSRGTVTAGAGLSSASGVVQAIQVAGDQNSVRQNALVIVSSDPVPAAGETASNAQGGSLVGASGASVSVALLRNRLNVEASVPGHGSVAQRISGAGLMQATQLAGDLNAIQSTLVLRVQLAPRSAGTALSAPAMMFGIRPATGF